MIGAGPWGMNHIRVWTKLGVLRAICDTSDVNRQDLQARGGGADFVTEFERVLERDDVNGVVIATPAATHGVLARAAITAGKDVLVEKPMALTVKEAVEIDQLAASNGVLLAVGHVLEYHPAVTKLRELLTEGVLGEIRYLYSNRLNLGRVRYEENALWSFAPHDVAMMNRLLDQLPVTVSCTGGAYLNPEVADVTLMSLTFPRGIMGHIFVSWLHPFKVHRFVLVGSERMADFDDTAPWDRKLRLFAHELNVNEGRYAIAHRADATAVPLNPIEPLELECKHFLDRIADRSTPMTGGQSGIDVLRVLEAGQRSLSQGGVPLSTT